MKKICCISDTHFDHNYVKIPKCDILIHAGDFSGYGTYEEVLQFASWIKQQPAEHIVVIAGNHDKFAEHNYYDTKLAFSGTICSKDYHRVHYLENQEVVIEGIKIFGSPFTPEFNNWSFMLPREELYTKVWSKIPEDIDILVTHGPQYGIADKVPQEYVTTNQDTRVGCKGLSKRISELKNLKLHVCGHLHSNHGIYNCMYADKEYVTIGASICNELYDPVNKPIMVNYEN